MRSQIINSLSCEDTQRNVTVYHKALINEVCCKFGFAGFSVQQFIALRKNVEVGFVATRLTDWECRAVFEYGKKHVFHEYYPLIVDLIKNVTIPRKEKDYGCTINYYHMFPPLYHEKMIYSFFVNFFDKPLFKAFTPEKSLLEQQLMKHISAFLCKQNKYGPEQINVAILDDQFLVVLISGLLTPFLQDAIKNGMEDDDPFIAKLFVAEGKTVLEDILAQYFSTKAYNPFIYFDKSSDKLIILSSLSKKSWLHFLSAAFE